ncbi:GroES-like protein [Hyaloraphidium curvatum]|nr:GroES-like protein [Hyaloraphidium curvatum]
MLALAFDQPSGTLGVSNVPMPTPRAGEVLVRVLRAGICATDLEIVSGYVKGFRGPLGHEFLGVVHAAAEGAPPPGTRVVGEINCDDAHYAATCSDAVFARNHAAGRSVLGIINRDGCFAEYVALPAGNLHAVPEALSDAEAAFCEPLAAACRIVEQGLVEGASFGPKDKKDEQNGQKQHTAGQQGPQRIAVVGDGRLGLLIAQVLAIHAPGRVTHFGRHPKKMELVSGTAAKVVVAGDGEPSSAPSQEHAGAFDLVVEASGSSDGIRLALALARAMGTIVLKTTVSAAAQAAVSWSELCNDIVVNEKILVGSRCGPMDAALDVMRDHPEVRALLKSMLQHEVPLSRGVEALELARSKGVLKVQLICSGGS